MQSIDARKKSRRGRPPVDSEEVRSRIAQPALGALDKYAEETAIPRAEAIRRILADWLRERGYLPK